MLKPQSSAGELDMKPNEIALGSDGPQPTPPMSEQESLKADIPPDENRRPL